MATKKITQKLRRFTHPNSENNTIKIPARLRQRNSFDVGRSEGTSGTRDKGSGGESSIEGRLRTSAKLLKSSKPQVGQKNSKVAADGSSDKTEKPGGGPDDSGSCFTSPTITIASPDCTETIVGWQDRSPDRSRLHASRSKTLALRLSRSTDRYSDQDACDRPITMANLMSLSNPPSEQVPDCDTSLASPVSPDGQRGRSQIRRAWSLFFLASDKEEASERQKLPQQQRRILRSPTRHVYRRGLSGLPILHSAKQMGLAF